MNEAEVGAIVAALMTIIGGIAEGVRRLRARRRNRRG